MERPRARAVSERSEELSREAPVSARESHPRRARAEAYLALAVLSLIWGYSWVAVKIATRDGSPLAVASLRAALGAVALIAVLASTRRSLRPPPFLPTLVYGLLQTTGFTLTQTIAVSIGDAGKVAILAYTMPIWLTLLASRFLGEKIVGAHLFALALAATGLGFIASPLGSRSVLANALAVTAGMVWAASAVWVMRVLAKGGYDLLSLTAWQMLWGALALIAVAVVSPFHVRWTPPFIASIAFLAIGATAFGWALWLFILSRLPAGVAGLGSLATPVVGLALAAVQLGERPSRTEMVGIACIVGALAVRSWTARSMRS
jgi:drug/metabolite transporter (DMT)-like permease